MFNQAAAQISIPCSAVGANAISLTPLTNCPALTSYNELGGYRFIAASTSSAAVTLQYNGLGLLPVYHIDGTTQANIGDLVAGEQYVVTFHQALNSGGGGFFLESPSIPNAPSTWYSPGGRLSLVSSTPVVFSNQSNIQTIFYSPYVHQFVPVYNGSIVQMVNFCSSLGSSAGINLSMGGASNFPINVPFDLFVTLVGSTPTIVAIQWTNSTTRATTLSAFAGFLTNSGSATAQTGPSTSTTLPANQGTFLGSFFTSAQGACSWQFAGSASGGSQGLFYLDNYYNKVLFTTQNTDTGANYTYTSGTVRQARASAQNQVQIMSASSERAIFAQSNAEMQTIASSANASTGIGINSTSAMSNLMIIASSATSLVFRVACPYMFTFTGFVTISKNEQGDGTNANVFDQSGNDSLEVSAWL